MPDEHPETKRWHTRIEENFVQPLAKTASVLMRATVWIVFMSGYALSALVFVHWASYSFGSLLFQRYDTAKEIMHALLLSIELLILVPVPGIVGIVTYRTLMQLSDTHQHDLLESKRQVHLAEELLIGLLVTVAGTTMLDGLILGEGDWLHYAGGAAIIGALSAFLWLTKN